MANDKIYVAKLGKAVGLKGHLKLHIDSDFPNQFKNGATFTTNRNITLIVQEYNSSRELIKFDGYDDVDISKKLTNQELYSTVDETKGNCKLQKNEYFWFDIMGSSIIEEGKTLGVVKDIHRYPITDYLEIATDKELEKEGLPSVFLIPYTMENYILEVDIKNKTITTTNCYEILENS